MDNIESLFATIADLVDPWGNVVNPLWAAFLERLEGAESSAGPVFLPLFILTPAQLNTWRAHLVGYGNDEQQYCYDFQIFLKQIRCQTTLTNSEEIELLGQIFGLLGTRNVSRLGFSWQTASLTISSTWKAAVAVDLHSVWKQPREHFKKTS